MNRLQKKCYIVSAGSHSLLVLILLVGPAFLSSKGKSDDSTTIDFVSWTTVDGLSGGGNPKAQPPPPGPIAPPQIQAAQPPPPSHQQPTRQTDPPKEIVRTSRPEPEALETSSEHKPKLPQISTSPVLRRTASQTVARQAQTTDNESQRLADARRRTMAAVGSTTQSLRANLSSAASIDTNYGPGGGGPAYANYAQLVKSIYESAWLPPDDTANDDAITKVTVTIASDGTVVSARILRACGEAKVDSSVQRTLDRVRTIAPFPEGAKEKQRTYTINFNLKAKRALG